MGTTTSTPSSTAVLSRSQNISGSLNPTSSRNPSGTETGRRSSASSTGQSRTTAVHTTVAGISGSNSNSQSQQQQSYVTSTPAGNTTSNHTTGQGREASPVRHSNGGDLPSSTNGEGASVSAMPSSLSRGRTAGTEGSGGDVNMGSGPTGGARGPTAAGDVAGSPAANSTSLHAPHLTLNTPYQISSRTATLQMGGGGGKTDVPIFTPIADKSAAAGGAGGNVVPVNTTCLNPASDVNSRLDTQVEIKVYPCNNSHGKKKFTQFMVKPEGVIIQGTNRPPSQDIGTEYSRHIGRKLPRYELSDTRASQLLITSHNKSYYVVPAPEAFSRHSGTCRLLGDRKHTPSNHSLKVGDFLRVGSVGVVVIETHNGVTQDVMSEDRIQKIMQDTTVGGYVDLDGETDIDDSSDVETAGVFAHKMLQKSPGSRTEYDVPTCYMCFDETDTDENPLISPCKCKGDTQFVHVECLRKWHTAEADNQVCFLSTVDATCSVCKSNFKSDFKLKSGQLVKLFQSSLEPPYVSLLIATKHEMAQRLFNTRFQLSFNTLLKSDGRNGTRPLLLGRSSGSDMVLDYRTVSARHASIKLKNGEFIFSDAGSSNGSYLYVRQPVELSPNGPSVQFRLGRSMISMKVVNKWNKRLLRAVVRRNGSGGTLSSGNYTFSGGEGDSSSGFGGPVGSGERGRPATREAILKSLPTLGMLSQQSAQHLDLVYALAIPKRDGAAAAAALAKRRGSGGSASGAGLSGAEDADTEDQPVAPEAAAEPAPPQQEEEKAEEVASDGEDLLDVVDSLDDIGTGDTTTPVDIATNFEEASSGDDDRIEDADAQALVDVVDEVAASPVLPSPVVASASDGGSEQLSTTEEAPASPKSEQESQPITAVASQEESPAPAEAENEEDVTEKMADLTIA